MNKKGFSPLIMAGAIVVVVLVGVIGYSMWKQQTQLQSSVQPESSVSIPTTILEKSNQVVIAQVGNDFFEKYISLSQSDSAYHRADDNCIKNPNSCAQYLQKPYYLMVYSLKIPEKSFVSELIEFAVDDNGNLITERGTYGIPDCLKESIKCDFSVDEAKAITIAKGAGLEKGMENWKASFEWDAEGMYVWDVQNTLVEDKQEGSSSGKAITIDANTGKVVGINNWASIP